MVKDLVHDTIFLAGKSEFATENDLGTAADLLDTLKHHKDRCVGMAANMIGVRKCIICFENNGIYTTMLNPKIIKFSEPYNTQESCLSLIGVPKMTKRYKKIKVQYQDLTLKTVIKSYSGFTALIIQHEVDHCNGILI